MEFKFLVVGSETYGDLNLNTNNTKYLSLNPKKFSTRMRGIFTIFYIDNNF